MELLKSSGIFAGQGGHDGITSLSISGCSRFQQLLVMISVSYQAAEDKSDVPQWLWFNHGTELCFSGVFKSNPTLPVRTYIVNVTSDTMTFNDMRCFNYQVYGLNETATVLDSTQILNPSSTTPAIIQQIDLSNTGFRYYQKLLILLSHGRYNGAPESTMRQSCYATGLTEISYSGGYTTSSSSSNITIAYLVSPSSIRSVLTNLSCNAYQIIGLSTSGGAAV